MQAILEFQGEYRWLSNFWECEEPIEVGKTKFSTVENAYQYAKAVMIGDEKSIEKLRTAATPWIAKRLSHMIIGDRSVFEKQKVSVMRGLLVQKFRKGLPLSEKLIATGDAELVEGNYWQDRFWGCSPVGSRRGENQLGKILMNIRESLK